MEGKHNSTNQNKKQKRSNITKLTKKHATKSATTETSLPYGNLTPTATYRGRRAQKWQWTVQLLNYMMHQRVFFGKLRGNGKDVLFEEKDSYNVCVCDNSVFFCLFEMDGV